MKTREAAPWRMLSLTFSPEYLRDLYEMQRDRSLTEVVSTSEAA